MAIETDDVGQRRLEQVLAAGVKRVRVHFTDLLGVSRNKVVPASVLEELAEGGLNFAVTSLAVSHAGEVIEATGLGADVSYRDMQAVPDLSTLRVVPWEKATGTCIADLFFNGEPLPCDPRRLLRSACAEAARRGYTAVCGHELEFFLLRPSGGGGYEQYAAQPGLVYTLSPSVDVEGVLPEMEDAMTAMGLPVTASNQEYFGSQWEINLRYADALEAADDAHLFKLAVKELALKHGLVATFMGKPLQDQGTSGYHLHLSLWDESGGNAFLDETDEEGLSRVCRHFIAGQLHHARGMTAIMAPTVNAYKRFLAMAFAPYWVTWGSDNRTVYVRVPQERGNATRIENRSGDGTANAYLSSAVAILAGLDGIDRELDPGAAVEGDAYSLEGGFPLMPLSLAEALDALEEDELLTRALGEQFVRAFVALKRDEVKRFVSSVTDWELHEYVNVL